jgi:hypothetical protein
MTTQALDRRMASLESRIRQAKRERRGIKKLLKELALSKSQHAELLDP